MIDKRSPSPRRRLIGAVSSIIAVAALAVTVLADNHDAGFGYTVTHGEQMLLFAVASLLLVAQAIAYLILPARRPTKRGPDRTRTAVPSAKARPWGKI